MRTVQPEGPYRIVGYSYGATIAFAMAIELQKTNENDVEQLVLLDGSVHYMATYRKIYRAAYNIKVCNYDFDLLCKFL